MIPPLSLKLLVLFWSQAYKCPQHRSTQQVYLPFQVPERQVSIKSTQYGLSL